MNAALANMTNALESEMLRCLADGIETQKTDDFIDFLFEMSGNSGHIRCCLTKEDVLSIHSRQVLLHEMEIPRLKSKMRLLCARLAVRCSPWAGRNIAPYGDNFECEYPPAKRKFTVQFENTTSAQEISIEASEVVTVPD